MFVVIPAFASTKSEKCKFFESLILRSIKLFQLSRRSRYLLSENFKKGEKLRVQIACATYSKHFKKAIFHLDIIINFIKNDYDESFEKVDIKCIDLEGLSFENFLVINQTFKP